MRSENSHLNSGVNRQKPSDGCLTRHILVISPERVRVLVLWPPPRELHSKKINVDVDTDLAKSIQQWLEDIWKSVYLQVYKSRGLLRSFNELEPGGLESTDKKVKERERGWSTLVYAESQQSPCMGLALFTKASGTLSMGWRRRAPSWEGLRSLGRKVNSESLCTPGDQPEKERERRREREREGEREREREGKTQGPELWWSKGVLINVCVYILSYKVVFLSKDKDQNSRLRKQAIHSRKRDL